jgi:hypothetical protein
MTRLQLFQWRLAASATLLLLLFGTIRLLWYPGDYFAIFGVRNQFLLLILISLVLGPALSVMLYKPGKKGLTFDLVVMATLELAVVIAAGSYFYDRQPYFLVFAVDRFEAVSRLEVDMGQVSYPALRERPGREPRLVYAEMPTDPNIFDRLINETVFEGKKDIDRRPEFWKPYPAGIATMRAAARPFSDLLQGDQVRAERARGWLAGREEGAHQYLYLPLRGKIQDIVIVLHAHIGYPVDMLVVDPW